MDRNHHPSVPPVLDPRATTALRERLYGAVSALSLLLVLEHGAPEAWPALATLVVTAIGLWGAAFVAEVLAHTAAHGALPSVSAIWSSLRATYQIVQATATPAVLLVLAGIGLIRTHTAIAVGIWVLEITLGLFAFVAVWRTPLTWPRKLVVTAVVMTIGIGVISLKTAVH